MKPRHLAATVLASVLASTVVYAAGQGAPTPDAATPQVPPNPPVPIDPTKRQASAVARELPVPDYPEDAACAGISGTPVLLVDLDATGKVIQARVEKSSRNRSLDLAAMAGARSFKFEPAIENGEKVFSTVRVPVVFNSGTKKPDYCKQPVRLVGFRMDGSTDAEAHLPRRDGRNVFRPEDTFKAEVLYAVIAPEWINKPMTATWRSSGRWGKQQVLRMDETNMLGDGRRYYVFPLPRPEGGWAQGHYSVEIRAGDKSLLQKRFVVEAEKGADASR